MYAGRDADKDSLKSKISTVVAYFRLSQRDFRLTLKALADAEKADIYARADTGLVRIKMKIAALARFRLPLAWIWATRGLSPEAEKKARIDLAEAYRTPGARASARSTLRSLERAARLDPEDIDTHKQLKKAYSDIGRLDKAIYEIRSVMRLLVDKEEYKQAVDYYDAEVALNAGSYARFRAILADIDRMRAAALDGLAKKAEPSVPEGVAPAPEAARAEKARTTIRRGVREAMIENFFRKVIGRGEANVNRVLKDLFIRSAAKESDIPARATVLRDLNALADKERGVLVKYKVGRENRYRLAPDVTVGIVGAQPPDEALKALRDRFGRTEFIYLGSEGGRTAEAKLASAGTGKVRVLLDVGALRTDELGKIVNAAGAQSFFLEFPYLEPLNDGNISGLSHDTLKDYFDTIIANLPEARSMDLDNILSGAFTGQMPAPPEGADAAKAAEALNDPEREALWISGYIETLKAAAKDPAFAPAKEARKYELASYLFGRSPSGIRSALARHQAIAAALHWRDKNAIDASAYMANMVEDVIGRADGRPCVLAFEAALISGKALDDLNKLAVQIDGIDKSRIRDGLKKSGFHILVLGADKERPAGLAGSVKYFTRNAEPVDAQIKNEPEFAEAYVSIALQRRTGDAMSDILGDFRSRKPSSYVVLGQEEKADLIVQVNIPALLYSISAKRPCGIFVGRFNGKDFNRIEETLAKIGGLYRMLSDIGKAISEIFQSIKAAAISV
jgi:hypothetical protein